MTIRFGGGEFIQGNSTKVLQRLAALTTNNSRPFIHASQGNNDQGDYSTAIFLDGKDAEGVKDYRDSLGAKAKTGYDLLLGYLDKLGFPNAPSGGMESSVSKELIRRIYLKEDATSI